MRAAAGESVVLLSAFAFVAISFKTKKKKKNGSSCSCNLFAGGLCLSQSMKTKSKKLRLQTCDRFDIAKFELHSLIIRMRCAFDGAVVADFDAHNAHTARKRAQGNQ